MLLMFAERFLPSKHPTEIDCLDPVNYDRLNFAKDLKSEAPPENVFNPKSLQDLACEEICLLDKDDYTIGRKYQTKSMKNCPVHLAEFFLRTAIELDSSSVIPFIANWPLETLCLREILSEQTMSVLEEEMNVDYMILQGITSRTRHCKLKTLDLRGIEINAGFIKLIVTMWPMLSLSNTMRNSPKKLTDIVLEQAGMKKNNPLSQDVIPKLVRDLLAAQQSARIKIPRGKKMVVLLDKVEFSTQSTFFMDYLITHCLKKVTPISVQVANITIQSDLRVGDEILDSLAPFIIFRAQAVESLRGISLANMEENVFDLVQKDLTPFKHLTALGLPNCSIVLREGRTRCRTRTRTVFIETLSSFQCLVKLDLSENSFAGCLGEVLDALHCPLVYLKLRRCDILNTDMQHLSRSRHAKSLQYLNVGRVCGLFPDDDIAVTSPCLVNCLRRFSQLRIVHLEQNLIKDSLCLDLCLTIEHHWPWLQAINLSGNLLSPSKCCEVVTSCARARRVEYVKLPHAHNMHTIYDESVARATFIKQLEDTAKANQKPQLKIHIESVSFSIFG